MYKHSSSPDTFTKLYRYTGLSNLVAAKQTSRRVLENKNHTLLKCNAQLIGWKSA